MISQADSEGEVGEQLYKMDNKLKAAIQNQIQINDISKNTGSKVRIFCCLNYSIPWMSLMREIIRRLWILTHILLKTQIQVSLSSRNILRIVSGIQKENYRLMPKKISILWSDWNRQLLAELQKLLSMQKIHCAILQIHLKVS